MQKWKELCPLDVFARIGRRSQGEVEKWPSPSEQNAHAARLGAGPLLSSFRSAENLFEYSATAATVVQWAIFPVCSVDVSA